MDDEISLKAEIEHEEHLYLIELRTKQRFDILKALKVKINLLKQKLAAFKSNNPPISGLSVL